MLDAPELLALSRFRPRSAMLLDCCKGILTGRAIRRITQRWWCTPFLGKLRRSGRLLDYPRGGPARWPPV